MGLIDWDSPLLADLNLEASDEVRAEAIIEATTAAMETYCKRALEYGSFDKVLPIKGSDTIFLDAYPVEHVTRILWDRVTALTLQSTATVSSFSVSETGLKLTRIVAGTLTSNTLAFSSYATLDALATAVAAVSTWSASVASGYGSHPSADLVAGSAGSGTASTGLDLWRDGNITFSVDRESGWISLAGVNSWLATGSHCSCLGSNYARIAWTGGYSIVPQDLQAVCAELVKQSWDGKAALITGESLGDYSYSLGEVDVARLPVTLKGILDSYRQRLC